jgi:D-alanyl-D-alanine carboxypeptidase (penicillin-binding protein 5/6)
MLMKKLVLLLAVFAVLNVDCARPKKQIKAPESKEFISAEYAVMLDCETGDRLFDKNADDRCVPSSMTKLMTLYILFSAIANGTVQLEDEFQVSETAQKMRGSRSFFRAGAMAKVEDLIRSIIVHSGNDASVIVAEGLSGDVSAFAIEMNEKAREFGLKNTHFTNSTGMPEDEHFSCMYDIAVIARRIIFDFPQFYHYFSEKTFTINEITQQNRNTMLGNSMGIDGLKTGKTNAGGYGIVVSAANNGKRLIAAVNGCKNAKERARDASKLLAVGFKEFDSLKIAEAGKPVTSAKVWLGTKAEVNLCTHENVIVSIPRKYRKLLTVEATLREPIDAPIILGTKLGELVYKYGNFVSKKYALFACEAIDKLGFFQRAIFSIRHLIFGYESKSEKERAVDVSCK